MKRILDKDIEPVGEQGVFKIVVIEHSANAYACVALCVKRKGLWSGAQRECEREFSIKTFEGNTQESVRSACRKWVTETFKQECGI